MAANLLKPAKDLAENWTIDVAAELDAYLNQLEASQKTFDEEQSATAELNFVEAALILQSSTSVYSKKVEYLRALAYETLNNFASSSSTLTSAQGRRGDEGSSTGKMGQVSTKAGRSAGHHAEDWDMTEAFTAPYNATTFKKEMGELDGADENRFRYFTTVGLSKIHGAVNKRKYGVGHGAKRTPLVLLPRDDRNTYRVLTSALHPGTGCLLVDPQDAVEFQSVLTAATHSIAQQKMLRNGAATTGRQSGLGADNFNAFQTSMSLRSTTMIEARDGMADGIGEGIGNVPNGSLNRNHPMSPQPLGTVGPITADCGATAQQPVKSRLRDGGLDDGDDGGDDAYDGQSQSRTRRDGQQENEQRDLLDVASTAQLILQPLGPNPKKTVKLKQRVDPLAFLDCHKPMGRDRPLQVIQNVGATFKSPDDAVYLSSAESLSEGQLTMMLKKGVLRDLYVRVALFDNQNKEDKEHLSEGEKEETLRKRLWKLSNQRLPFFPDLKCPAYPFSEHFQLGPEWHSMESDFWMLKKVWKLGHEPGCPVQGVLHHPHSQGAMEDEPALLSWGDDGASDGGVSDGHDSNRQHNAADGCASAFDAAGILAESDNDNRITSSGGMDAKNHGDGHGELTIHRRESLDVEAVLRNAQSTYVEVLQRRLEEVGHDNGTVLNGSSGHQCEAVSQIELHKRMTAWRHRVKRWMVMVNSRGTFDVADYKQRIGKKILDASSLAASGSQQISESPAIPFSVLVKGETRSDVCRYFLASLVMSNEHTIQVVDPGPMIGDGDDTEGSYHQQLIPASPAHHRRKQQDLCFRLVASFEEIKQGVIKAVDDAMVDCNYGDGDEGEGRGRGRGQRSKGTRTMTKRK